MKDTSENDRSEYVNTGMRDPDAREGFGDDAGTRVGRPDGAGSNASAQDPNGGGARVAPHDVSGPPIPGQAGTNTSPVADGIEGSLEDGDVSRATNAGSGPQQSRAQAAAEEGLNDQQAAGDNRRVDNL